MHKKDSKKTEEVSLFEKLKKEWKSWDNYSNKMLTSKDIKNK